MIEHPEAGQKVWVKDGRFRSGGYHGTVLSVFEETVGHFSRRYGWQRGAIVKVEGRYYPRYPLLERLYPSRAAAEQADG